MSVLLTPGLRDSPLAQLVKELDLCLFLCVIQRQWDQQLEVTLSQGQIKVSFNDGGQVWNEVCGILFICFIHM